MADGKNKLKSIIKGLGAILGIRLIDPVEVFYLTEDNTFYPIISKSACSSIKVMLIRRYFPEFESKFPEIHRIDPARFTNNKVQRFHFYHMNTYEKWTRGKKMVLIIRDPISRFYSCYIDVKKGKNRMYSTPSELDWIWKFNPDLSLSEFYKRVIKINDRLADRHFRSQSFCLNARVRKSIYALEIYELDAFMNNLKTMNSEKNLEPQRLNTNKETIPPDVRSELEHDPQFIKRFSEDIQIFKKIENSAGRFSSK